MTEQFIVFQENYPAIVLIIAGVLLVAMILREWLRENKRRRIWRTLAAVFVLVALLGIIYEPAIRRPIERSNLVILTQDYNQDQLDSLNRVLPKFTVVREDTMINTVYPDLDEFGQTFVLGNGLPSYDLWQFKGRQVIYLSGALQNGITQLKTPETVYQEAEMNLRGHYQTDLQNVQLILNGPEGKLDSTFVNDRGFFELTTVPKASGNFIYTISISGDVNEEKLPITVLPQKKLKVLVINAFPTFETRYLKTFLARKGHELVLRNQVSKNVFRFEYFNTQERRINRLTQAELEAQDLLIMDLESLNSLSSNEQQLLRTAINEEGLGLFIQPEQALFANQNWLNLQSSTVEEETVLFDVAADTLQLSKYGLTLTTRSNQYALLQASNQEPLVLAERSGLGKIGTTVLKDIYRQQLSGDSLVYAYIWTKLLNGLSKENKNKVSWSGLDQIVYPLEPMEFTVQNIALDDKITIDGHTIPLVQDALIPEQWKGTYWPREKGWHQLNSENDSTAFYVYDKADWKARKAFFQIQANQQFFAQQTIAELTNSYHHKTIPKLWFYLVFLLLIGFLWLEPKL